MNPDLQNIAQFEEVKPLQMRSGAENIIKQEIEFMFGRRIVSSRDCIQLCEEIFRVTKSQLNPNTLRRFFGLVKTVYSPAPATLQILCNYCGFSSVEDLESKKLQNHHSSETIEEKKVLDYLVSLFKEAPVKTGKDKIFISVVKQTILFLNQHQELIERFQSLVAKTKNGRDYYFETFVDIDHLNSFYGDGLRYYLNETTDPGAQIFGHSLLSFRYWLTADDNNLEHHFKKVTDIVKLYPLMTYQSAGRYFSCLLFYNHAKEQPSMNTVIDIHAYYDAEEGANLKDQLYFETAIAEALILTGTYEEGLFYTELALKKNFVIGNIEEQILHYLNLIKAFALYKMGDIKNAERVYEIIRPSAFNFLSKKMQTILYVLLTGALKKRHMNKTEDQPWLLIEETGFKRMKNWLVPR